MKRFFLFLAMVGLLLTSTANAQVPNKISYQGLLTTSSGTPVQDGNYNLKFEIYNLPSGGNLRYSETQNDVPVLRGTFSVVLRPYPTIFSESLYVQVTALAGSPGIISDITFSPRSELTSAPYALRLNLPFADTLSSSECAFYVSNIGSGEVGKFIVNNPSSNSVALRAITNGNKEAFFAQTQGSYCAGQFEINNPGSIHAALVGYTNGSGPGVRGWTNGTGAGVTGDNLGIGNAARFTVNNPSNYFPALYVTTNGSGPSAVFEGGNVGIGTTIPDANAKLDVNGYAFAKAPVVVYDSAAGSGQNYNITWHNDVRLDNNIVEKQLNNYDFMLKKAGWYRVSYFIYFDTPTRNEGYEVDIWKNSILYKGVNWWFPSSLSNGGNINGTFLIQSDGDDLFKIHAVSGSTLNPTFSVYPQQNLNQLSIEYLGAE